MEKLLCWWPFLLFSAAASAQTSTPSSLKDMVTSSISNNPSIKVKQAQLVVGTASVMDAKNAWIPSVRVGEQMTVGSDNGLSGPYFSMGFVPSISGGRRAANKTDLATGNLAAIVAEWEIFNFGAYGAREKEAYAGLKVNEADLEREKYETQWLVIRQYFDLIMYRQLMTIQQKNLERARGMKLIIGTLAESGLKPGADTSFTAAELSKMRLIYLDMENSYALTRNQLVFFTGIDAAKIEPDTAITLALSKMLALASNNDANTASHPDVLLNQAMYERGLAQAELLRKSAMPKVSLLGAGMLRGSSISPNDVYDDNPLEGLVYSRSNYILGATLTYNLTDPTKIRYKREIQLAQTEVTRQSLEVQKSLLNNNLLRTDINLKTTSARLQEIPYQNRAASEAYQQKLALYNSGLTNIADLTTALYMVNRAELDNILAQNAAWKAIIDKLSTSGQISFFLSNLQ